MPNAYPAEFRRDVVAVARKHEAPLSQIAKELGISEASLHDRLEQAAIEQGVGPGVIHTYGPEMRARLQAVVFSPSR
ncbi:MAG: transposase [Lacisediminihabitans sp.]